MLDLIKPMRSGVDVCRQIRSMSDAPVVSLSGVEDVEFGKELLAPPPPAKQPQQTADPRRATQTIVASKGSTSTSFLNIWLDRK